MRRDIVEECHDSADGGHRGIEKTLARIRQRFWGKGIASTVKSYVKSCHFGQTFKPRVGLPVGKLRPIPPLREMFHTLGIDHLGPFKTTIRGNRHLIVCIDYLSRWIEARPVASTGVDEVLPFLEEALILHHGTPTRIISDKGPCFTSFAFSAFCDKWIVKHVQASAEHPETNGLVERINSSIASTLAAFVNFDHYDWDEGIARAVFSINTSKQSTTEITPFELVFGRPAVMSLESAFPWPPSTPLTHEERVEVVSRWRKIARRLIIIRQKKSKLNYDRFRKADPIFQIGELVLIARRRKTKKHEEIHPAIRWAIPSLPQCITYMLCSRRFTVFPKKTTLAPFQCTRQANQAIFYRKQLNKKKFGYQRKWILFWTNLLFTRKRYMENFPITFPRLKKKNIWIEITKAVHQEHPDCGGPIGEDGVLRPSYLKYYEEVLGLDNPCVASTAIAGSIDTENQTSNVQEQQLAIINILESTPECPENNSFDANIDEESNDQFGHNFSDDE
ncbi:Uncharacterized protein APZ42_033158 [Daphnia magna]|uniref:RNA-directed DNA polymerase n=1 Tax=Daphnia magna TaxID=35525 RepID=A0A164LCL1_9CRUS|nr:Uncharacterized protein APZ42_033158 [Daphnia magna]